MYVSKEARTAYLDAARIVDELILGVGEMSDAGRTLAVARHKILERAAGPCPECNAGYESGRHAEWCVPRTPHPLPKEEK